MKARSLQRFASLLVLVSLVMGTRWAVYAANQESSTQATTNYSFAPVADAFVLQSYPTTNYGTSRVLRADSSPITRSYLRFAVTGLNGAAIQSAKIQLYANTSNSTGISVYALSNNTWTETTITYNNSPAPGSIINSIKPVTSGTWAVVDVSNYVKAQATYNFVVSTTSSTNTKLSSREATGYVPKLVVTVAATATATATRTLVPTSTSTKSPATATNTAAPTSTAAIQPSDTPTSTETPTQPPTASATPTATTQPTDWQPAFPIRATFYYPWFPGAWTQSSIFPYTNYTPKLGFYSSKDAATLQQHLDMMQYAGIQAGIASWWGQGSSTDVNIPGLLSAAEGSHFRWSLYYENESTADPTASQIQSDLTYIRDHYGNDPSFLRINGKFVVFVYAAGNDGCGMIDRWKQGNTVGAYVVLKVFSGYLNCANQPDSWHQYSPAVATDRQGSLCYAISPGFWQKGGSVRLARDVTRWTQNVKDMVASGTKWQLVTTFSEWGEGTAVEPAVEWASSSGYGQYLDVLHYNGNMPAP
jgi:hypothetical protein